MTSSSQGFGSGDDGGDSGMGGRAMQLRNVRQVCVIGMGRFGLQLAELLGQEGKEVVAIDSNQAAIEAVRDKVHLAVIGDGTDPDVLRNLGVESVDLVVIAIGEDFEAALLTFAAVRELGAKQVVVRAQDRKKRKILRTLGCEWVIMPEEEAAIRLANLISNPYLNASYELGRHHSITQVVAPRKMYGRPMSELKLRERFNINLAAIRSKSQNTIIITRGGSGAQASPNDMIRIPAGNTVVHEGDILILVGRNEDIDRFLREFE